MKAPDLTLFLSYIRKEPTKTRTPKTNAIADNTLVGKVIDRLRLSISGAIASNELNSSIEMPEIMERIMAKMGFSFRLISSTPASEN